MQTKFAKKGGDYMSVAGIIFSNLHDRSIAELTRTRTMASIPFLCRYRFIDFPLSNMVNAGIKDIKVITHYNYHSLMEHIGSGKDWDLAIRSGGIKILPPYITAYANYTNVLYDSRLEALKSVHYSLQQMKEDFVVLSDCDVICNMDIASIVNSHIKSGAEVTVVVKRQAINRGACNCMVIESDADGRLTDVVVSPKDYKGECDLSLNVMVMSRKFLNSVLLDAIAHDYKSFRSDVILRNKDKTYFRIHRYDGYVTSVDSFNDYYNVSMELLQHPNFRRELFGTQNREIYTKVRNSPPTRYGCNASTGNSLIADGCVIEGCVENCILFRGVKIGRNAVVKNSILFQDVYVGDNAVIDCVVADKRAVFRDGTQTCGTESAPLYIDKAMMV